VHRAIKAILHHTRYVPALAAGVQLNSALSPKARRMQAEADKATPAAVANKAKIEAIWHELGVHCSANERRADEASRDVEAWLKCYFMRDKLGNEFSGTVSAVTSFGIFVQLDELYVEGLVHVTELGSDYFQYDEARNELRGERTGIRYAIGTRVRVQVSRVDLDGRRIDFRLVHEDEGLLPRAMKDKGIAQGGPGRMAALERATPGSIKRAPGKAASLPGRAQRSPKQPKTAAKKAEAGRRKPRR
jgi:ribonuclease R